MKICLALKCSYSVILSYGTYTKKMISNRDNLLASLLDYHRNLSDLPVSILALHCPQPLTSRTVYFQHSRWSDPLLCWGPFTAPDFIRVWGQVLTFTYKTLHTLPVTSGPSSLLPAVLRANQSHTCSRAFALGVPSASAPLPPDPRGPTSASLQPVARLSPSQWGLPWTTQCKISIHTPTLEHKLDCRFPLPCSFSSTYDINYYSVPDLSSPHKCRAHKGRDLSVSHWHILRTWNSTWHIYR